MQVFVTGATGYIGFAVAAALRRAGYRVWGLARSEAKARRLTRHEIEPVVGDLADPKTYVEVASDCALLVHTAFDYSADEVAKDKTAIDTLLDVGRRGVKPKTLVFTSGAWVYGDTGDRMVDETTPPNPAKLVAWRPGRLCRRSRLEPARRCSEGRPPARLAAGSCRIPGRGSRVLPGVDGPPGLMPPEWVVDWDGRH